MVLKYIDYIKIEYKGVTQNLTAFRILVENELENMLYQYFQKKYTKPDSVKKCGRDTMSSLAGGCSNPFLKFMGSGERGESVASKEANMIFSSMQLVFFDCPLSYLKYMNRLLRFNFIYQVERRGRNVYYEISPDLTLLEP
jgi:hypothetical protein